MQLPEPAPACTVQLSGGWAPSAVATVPPPSPAPVTPSAKLRGTNRAVTARAWLMVTVQLPVPLHASRERERGFNQAVVLARELARATKLPIDDYSLVRRVHTERHRAGMDARSRRDSVEGAFEVRRPEPIAGRRVLLIDDVFTTGATVSECAAVLKSAGGTAVYVLTIARA